jgi:Bacterial Ig-like domain
MKNHFYIFLLFFICASCAQFVPPTGGKKDIIPPKVLNTIPAHKTRNFLSKTISLTFDEYIDIASIKQDLLIIPDPKSTYIVKQKGKNILLVFDKPFEKNTTYTFNFRTGIKDLNERNPASNLKLVFSTGPILDSLSIKGNVRDIQTKLPVLESTVALYKADTTPMFKRKPDYFIKTDSAGNYSLENLKANKYAVISFTDINNNLRYDQKTEQVGFHPDSVALDSNYAIPTIEIYRSNQTPNKIKKGISREKEYLIQLDKPVREVKLFDSLDYHLPDRSTLSIYKTDKILKDTLQLKFLSIDSLLHVDTLKQKVFFTKPLKSQKKSTLAIKSDIKSGQFLTNNILYNITFDLPVSTFKEDKLIFKTDTLAQEKPTLKWLSKNHLTISIKTKAKLKTDLLFLPNAFVNIKGDTSAIFGLSNTILQEKDLGTLSGSLKGTTAKIVQLIDTENSQISKEIMATKTFSFKDIIPSTYILKVIYDDNKNGIWDPGNLTTKTMPEKISLSKEPIKIKANFEIKNINVE